MSSVDELIHLATECLKTDYGDSQSVRRDNTNAKKIGRLIARIDKETDLLLLLETKATQGWVAYQLLKRPDELSGLLKTKAMGVLKGIGKAGGHEALPATLRLRELK